MLSNCKKWLLLCMITYCVAVDVDQHQTIVFKLKVTFKSCLLHKSWILTFEDFVYSDHFGNIFQQSHVYETLSLSLWP